MIEGLWGKIVWAVGGGWYWRVFVRQAGHALFVSFSNTSASIEAATLLTYRLNEHSFYMIYELLKESTWLYPAYKRVTYFVRTNILYDVKFIRTLCIRR